MKHQNEDNYEALFLLALAELERGASINSIELLLRQTCEDVVLIAVVLKEARNAHDAALRRQGFRLIGLGCMAGLFGFLLTLFNFNTSRSIDLAMYGLTTAGIVLVFWGLYKILG